MASTCTAEAAGAYRIEVAQLPTDVTARHDQLVRRLLAGDPSIDLLSLDSSFTAELAAAELLTPVPQAKVAQYGEGVAPAALAAATYGGRLVAAPWFFDPQVLWYRGNIAERAGLDTRKPISWDDLVAGAERLGVTVQIEDRDGSGISEWVSALVAGAGGSILDGSGRGATVGLDTTAGRAAASVVEFYRQAGVGPGPSAEALREFAAPGGGFLLASTSAISDPTVAAVQADMSAAAYPVVGDASIAPLAGVALAVPSAAPTPDLSFRAIDCLTSAPVLEQLMTGPQHAASRLSTFDAEDVASSFRSADVARAALESGATVPSTPYWSRIVGALDETWLPISGVGQDGTPESSQNAVEAVVQGRLP